MSQSIRNRPAVGPQLVAGVRLAVGRRPRIGCRATATSSVVAGGPAGDVVESVADLGAGDVGVRARAPRRSRQRGRSTRRGRGRPAAATSGDRSAGRWRGGARASRRSRPRSRGSSDVPSRHGVQLSPPPANGTRARASWRDQRREHELEPAVAQADRTGVRRLQLGERRRGVGTRVVGDEESRLRAGVRRPVVGAEADRQIGHPVDVRVPGPAYLGQHVGVVDARGRLKHGRTASPAAGRRRARGAACGSGRAGRPSARRVRRWCPR